LDLQLPVQSMSFTTDVCANPAQDEVYNIMW
jgi:hypothetical protein